MDLEQLHPASSRSCSDSEEPNTASGPSESPEDNVDQLDSASTQHDNGSQTASLDDTSTDTMNKDTNQEHITPANGLENCSQSVVGKLEKNSENAYSTPNMLDSAQIEPKSPISHVPPSESPHGEHIPIPHSTVDFRSGVLDIHMEAESFPSPDDSSDVLTDVYDNFDVPSSSPPVSSPLTAGYCRSSSPIPMASSPYGYDLTPPTSPVRISNASAELADIQIDKVSDIEQLEIIFGRPELGSEETVSGPDENANVTASEYTSNSMSPEESVPSFSTNKDDAHLTDHGITPRDKRFIPGPKRATLAAQKVRLQKLSKPFRPPAIQKPAAIIKQENITPSVHDATYKSAAHTSSFAQKIQEKMRNRTAKAAAQFKSPLASSSTAGEEGPLVRPTPTIQALERKLQLLKRAVKVKEGFEEEALCGLIQKWTEAGREIAWEVWGLVKENVDAGSKRQMEDSWGWQDAGDPKRQKTEERLWGWDVIPVAEREGEQEQSEVEEGPRRTVGTMLAEMGIAPEMFGWNAEEERFEE